MKYALATILCVLATSAQDIRIAVVAESTEIEPLAEMLSIRLSEAPGIAVLERQQIRKLLQEKRIELSQVARSKPGVLPADRFVVISAIGNASPLTSVRVFDSKTGRRLDEALFPETVAFEDRLRRSETLILSLKAAKPGSEFAVLRRGKDVELVAALLEFHLGRIPGVSIAERRHLKWLGDEQDIAQLRPGFSPATRLLILNQQPDGKLEIQMQNGSVATTQDFAVSTPPQTSEIEAMTGWILGSPDRKAVFDADLQSVRYFHAALRHLDEDKLDDAVADAQVAYALNRDEYAMIHLLEQALLQRACRDDAVADATRADELTQRLRKSGNVLQRQAAYPRLDLLIRDRYSLSDFLRIAAKQKGIDTRALRQNYRDRRFSKLETRSTQDLRKLFVRDIELWVTSPEAWLENYRNAADAWRDQLTELSAAELLQAEPDLAPAPHYFLPVNLRLPDAQALPIQALSGYFSSWSAGGNPLLSFIGQILAFRIRKPESEQIDRVQSAILAEIAHPRRHQFWSTPNEARELLYRCAYAVHRLNATSADDHKRFLQTMLSRKQLHACAEALLREMTSLKPEDYAAQLHAVQKALQSSQVTWCGPAGGRDRLWAFVHNELKTRKVAAWKHMKQLVMFDGKRYSWTWEQEARMTISDGWVWTLRPYLPLCVLAVPEGGGKVRELMPDLGKSSGIVRDWTVIEDAVVFVTGDAVWRLPILSGKANRIAEQGGDAIAVHQNKIYLVKTSKKATQILQINAVTGKEMVLADSSRLARKSALDNQSPFQVPWLSIDRNRHRVLFTLRHDVLARKSSKLPAGLWAYDIDKGVFACLKELRFSSAADHNSWMPDGSLLIETAATLLRFDPERDKFLAVANRAGRSGRYRFEDYFRGVQAVDNAGLWIHANEDRTRLKLVFDGGSRLMAPIGTEATIHQILPGKTHLFALTDAGVLRLDAELKLPQKSKTPTVKVGKLPRIVNAGAVLTLELTVPKGIDEIHWHDREPSRHRDFGRFPVTSGKMQLKLGPLRMEASGRRRLVLSCFSGGKFVNAVQLPSIFVQSPNLDSVRRRAAFCRVAIADSGAANTASRFLKAHELTVTHIATVDDLKAWDGPGVIVALSWLKANPGAETALRNMLKADKSLVLFGTESTKLWGDDFPLPVNISTFSTAAHGHFLSATGRWPSRWQRKFETFACRWSPKLGNLLPVLDDSAGRRIVYEFFPQPRGRVAVMACPIAADLDSEPWALELLARAMDYAGRPWKTARAQTWRKARLKPGKTFQNVLSGMTIQTADEAADVLITEWTAKPDPATLKFAQDGGTVVMLAPHRGITQGTRYIGNLANGYSLAWVDRLSASIPLDAGAWEKKLGNGYRQEVIPGFLCRMNHGYGQFVVLAAPPKESRQAAQENLAILLTNLRVYMTGE